MCRGGKGVPWRLPCRPACIHKTGDRSQDAHQNIIEARRQGEIPGQPSEPPQHERTRLAAQHAVAGSR